MLIEPGFEPPSNAVDDSPFGLSLTDKYSSHDHTFLLGEHEPFNGVVGVFGAFSSQHLQSLGLRMDWLVLELEIWLVGDYVYSDSCQEAQSAIRPRDGTK